MTMHHVEAGGASIPSLGLGTWTLRGEDCAEAVAFAITSGYRHVDTAAGYGNEEAVGEGIKASRIARAEIFLTTKVGRDEIDEGRLERSAEASLKRLGVSHVDLLLIHWPNTAIPQKRSIAALCKAKRRGLTKHIGVSNFTAALLAEAVSLADEPIIANQCEYHPRLDQSRVLSACREHGVAFTSYCPLGQGGSLLSDQAIATIAKRHGKTPAQTVLRWHVQQKDVVAIPKSGNRKRITENMGIFDFVMNEDEMQAISALATPNGRIISPGWSPAWDR